MTHLFGNQKNQASAKEDNSASRDKARGFKKRKVNKIMANQSANEVKLKSSKFTREKKFKQRKSSFQEVARNRIVELFIQAEKTFSEDEKLAKRYLFLAKSIALKYKVPFTRDQKLRCCKFCGSFLKQGLNSRIRLSKGNLVLKCLCCNNIRRFKLK